MALPPDHSTLPTLLTHFIGRQHEVTELRARLAATRCLSLVGTGGCGKTRLAHRVAQVVEPQFGDGVCWVELASIHDPAFVLPTVARQLNIIVQPETPLLTLLVAKLANRHLLVVLDNCEHLLASCAELVETLLRATPIQIMATSREPLGVTGETLYPVPPLTLPAPQQPLVTVAACDAIQFFLERTRSIQPAFAVTLENAELVADLCRRLDGLPLAIELACARLNVLSVAQIAERLTQRLDLLVATPRSDPRHRTLRNAIDWSYDLLTPAEQRLLQRLALFAGGFTLNTVEAACAWGELARPQILELLASLVNKSLVVVETIQAREARYRLLETIRQYASEKLRMSGQWTETYDRFLAAFVGYAEAIAPKLYEQYQQLWMHWLEGEHGNLRGALAWALESGRIESGLRIAVALARFWEIRSYVQEGLTWFECLFARLDSSGTTEEIALAVRVNAFSFAAFFAAFLGHADPCLAYGRQAVDLSEATGEGDVSLRVMALSGLSSGLEMVGDYQAAFATHERTLALLRPALHLPAVQAVKSGTPDVSLIFGMTVLTQGGMAIEVGDYPSAQRYLAESLALARTANDPFRMAFTFYYFGNLAYCQQQYQEAHAHYAQSVQLARQLDATRDLAAPLQGLGYSCLHLGEVGRAAQLFQEVLTIHQNDQNRLGMVESLLGFATLAIQQATPAVGVRLLAAAEAMGWRRAKASWAVTRQIFDHFLAQARRRLPAAEFQAAQSAGQQLALAEALALAQNLSHMATPVPAKQEMPDDLTEREREVVILIALGKSNSAIAEQLVLSKRTVEKHIANILAKLAVTNRAQIVRWAIDHGLTGNNADLR